MDLDRLIRGQLVLSAAAIIVVALVAVLFAYAQLGYHPDLQESHAPEWDATHATLDRVVHDAVTESAGDYTWDRRHEIGDVVRNAIRDRIATLESKNLESGVLRTVEFDPERAETVATEACPSGPGRRFGECAAIGGVVLQERAGDAVVLAVGFDVDVVGPNRRVSWEIVITVGE